MVLAWALVVEGVVWGIAAMAVVGACWLAPPWWSVLWVAGHG